MKELNVGFVGLGMMGLPMVERLASGEGLAVRVVDSAESQLQRLHANPAWGDRLRGDSRMETLAGCDVVVTMLPDSRITHAVVAGTDLAPGLASVLQRGAIVVDMGSSDPTDTKLLAQQLAERGIAMLDAPVSGSVAKALDGSLSIMIGGAEADIQRARPVLERLGSKLIPTGAIGSAHAMKSLNNYVYAAGLLATSEALLIAQRMGLDLDCFAEVLNASSGRNVATEAKLRQFIIPRTFDGGFALRLQAKDLATAGRLGQAAGIEARQLALCAALWQEALQALEPGVDNTAILRFLERESGPST